MLMQVQDGNDKCLVKLDESQNNILKNFDADIDNNEMPSDEEDEEENPELLAELEKK